MNNWKEIALASLFTASLIGIAVARNEYHKAVLQRVAACQMLPDHKLWDDFGCPKAFKEAQK